MFTTLTVFLFSPLFCIGQNTKTAYVEVGVASYYHDKFVGRKTATGEIFVQDKMTAAHKTLPLNSWVKVTNLSNDSVVVLRINDRMPLWNKRSIDLTEAAAKKLNYLHAGLTKVKIEVIPDPRKKEQPPKVVMDKNLITQTLEPYILKELQLDERVVMLRYPRLTYVAFILEEPLLKRWWSELMLRSE